MRFPKGVTIRASTGGVWGKESFDRAFVLFLVCSTSDVEVCLGTKCGSPFLGSHRRVGERCANNEGSPKLLALSSEDASHS